MKPRVYLVLFLLILPVQASLLDRLSISGIKPDLALSVLFIIGLLTSPVEATLAGMCIGLAQDIGSASLIGFSAFTRGLAGLAAGLLGARILDIGSPVIVLFLVAFSLTEGVLVSLFLQAAYGDMPFVPFLFGRLLPQALYTGMLGLILLRLANKRKFLASIKRRDLQKEP